MRRGLFSESRGGMISRSTHFIPEENCPSTCCTQNILKISKRSGGKTINHTSIKEEKALDITPNEFEKLERKVFIFLRFVDPVRYSKNIFPVSSAKNITKKK